MSHEPGSVSLILGELNQGDYRRFGELVEKIAPTIRRMVEKQAKNQDVAPNATDTTNETMLRLWQQYQQEPEKVSFNNRQELFTWLKVVSRRIQLNEIRQWFTHQNHQEPYYHSRPTDFAGDPDLEIDAKDAIDRLKVKNSKAGKIVELRFLEGYTNKTIAAELGCTERNVEQNYTFGRAQLTQILRDWDSNHKD